MTRADPGFMLAQPRLGTAAKAERVSLDREMTVAEGFEAIADNCLRHFRLNHRVFVAERCPGALHQARVALRRLRSAISLFGSAVEDEAASEVREDLRWLAGVLGEARDLDVALKIALTPEQERTIWIRREQRYDEAVDALQSVRFRSAMTSLAAWAAAGDWRRHRPADEPLTPYVNRRIGRLWRKMRAAKRPSRMDDEHRHRTRILVKKLRYSLEFARELQSRKAKRRRRFVRTLEGLQDSLGLLNDETIIWAVVGDGHDIARAKPVDRKRVLKEADHALGELRQMGPYWR